MQVLLKKNKRKTIATSSEMIASKEWIAIEKLRNENEKEEAKTNEHKFLNNWSKGNKPKKRNKEKLESKTN